MSEWHWLRAWPSGKVHLFYPETATALCGNGSTTWTAGFPPGCKRCWKCFTEAGLPLLYEEGLVDGTQR